MPKKELKVDDLTQEELDYILKKRQRESRARMKSESALQEYLRTLPTINAFLKKTGLLGKPQTSDIHKGLYALEHRILNDPSSPIILRQHYDRKISDVELNVSKIEIITRSLCGIKFPDDLFLDINTYNNKVFSIDIYTNWNFYNAEKAIYEASPLRSCSGTLFITTDFKENILKHFYRNYQLSILSAERDVRRAKEVYDEYKNQVKELKKILGKNYSKYKNMFTESELFKSEI